MDTTATLGLPYILGAQAQKHVTHNEALTALDALVQLSVLDRDLSDAPSEPSEGDRYIVPADAGGAWTGKTGQVAAFQGGTWAFYPPGTGWLAFVADEGVFRVFDGTAWQVQSGGSTGGPSVLLNEQAHGAETRFELIEDELTLSGAMVESTAVIPDRSIVFAVTTRTTEAIAGAASYDCGIAGEPGKYGSTLGTAAGSTNAGVTGPTAFYADTFVRITANGGAFSDGKVRIAIHALLCRPSAS
ncbi:hypothetical protein AB7M35_002810 [Amorphus suaedae]